MVGFAQLFGIRSSIGSAEVSYWIGPDDSGRGEASAAVNVLCQIAFEELGLHRVELRCAVDNAASLGVARKAGFTVEGVLRDAWRVHLRRQSLAIHSRLATDSAPKMWRTTRSMPAERRQLRWQYPLHRAAHVRGPRLVCRNPEGQAPGGGKGTLHRRCAHRRTPTTGYGLLAVRRAIHTMVVPKVSHLNPDPGPLAQLAELRTFNP